MVDSEAAFWVLIQIPTPLLRLFPYFFLYFAQASIYPNECCLASSRGPEVESGQWCLVKKALSPSLSAVLYAFPGHRSLCDHGSVSKLPAYYTHQNEALTLTLLLFLKGLVNQELCVCMCLCVCVSIKSYFRPTNVQHCYNAAPVWQAWLCKLMGLTVNKCGEVL